MGKVRKTLVIVIVTVISLNYLTENPQLGEVKVDTCYPDLKFVKKISFFASNKQRKCIIISNLVLFWLKLNKCVNSVTVMKKVYI